MKRTLKAAAFIVTSALAFVASAEPVEVSVTPTGYLVAGKSVATPDQVIAELKVQNAAWVALSLNPVSYTEQLNTLIAALQKQGIKVGLIVSPASQ